MINKEIIYKSVYLKYPLYISLFSIIFSYIIFQISGFDDFYGILKLQLILYIPFSILYFKRFIFYEDSYIVELPLRIIERKIRKNYTEIKYFEVRMRVAPYSYPKCLVHYPEWYRSQYFFADNTFEIKTVQEVLPLIENLINNNVVIQANMTYQYEKEYNTLVAFIKEKGGTLHPESLLF